jgi:hypothetical protein
MQELMAILSISKWSKKRLTINREKANYMCTIFLLNGEQKNSRIWIRKLNRAFFNNKKICPFNWLNSNLIGTVIFLMEKKIMSILHNKWMRMTFLSNLKCRKRSQLKMRLV